MDLKLDISNKNEDLQIPMTKVNRDDNRSSRSISQHSHNIECGYKLSIDKSVMWKLKKEARLNICMAWKE